ncbi:hypothetical protein JAAARDRAFT_28237 [Jaapia argillacea MUCL 33604]|uniref:RTA1-domain-containing protein n=1 Tax=Jaapia argillacea MUCL 33604 TaxID=933084 RepID=A0A067QCB7_9AGAM|nr:hypothetical protein JAAARDRAFT_28237 [Jaapia argillacea MUCL 33604]
MLGRTSQLWNRSTALAALCIAVALIASTPVDALKQPNLPHVANPFADPKDDPYNPLRYIASNALTAVAFSLVLLCALFQSYAMRKWGAIWMMCMVIGEYTFATGIALRFGLHKNPDSKGIYIAEYLLVVLSPCAFIAGDYILLGRLARYLKCDKHLLIRPSRITLVFVCSDITTFLIQALGGSVEIATTSVTVSQTGSHIFLAGLAAQLASFFFFTCTYLLFFYRVHKYEPQAWTKDEGKKWYHDWRTLGYAIIFSCIGILIRSVYRTIELSQGFRGYLATTERFFYGLDTLPLFIAVAIYVPFWPGRFIPPFLKEEDVSSTRTASEETGQGHVEEEKAPELAQV